ncbi:MAG: hypothetical protein AAFX05_03120 [Planctomycetota bacterium]
MDRSEAYQRRVWRLALLLTDSGAHADATLAQVLRTQSDILRVGESRLERMVVLASRQTTASGGERPLNSLLELDESAGRLWNAVRQLEQQPREAWLFRDLEGADLIPAARAMDCSRTALEQVHRKAALESLQATLGDHYDDALVSLRSTLEAIDPTEALELATTVVRQARARRRLVTVVVIVLLLVCFGVLLFVMQDLLGWEDRHDGSEFLQPDQFVPTTPSLNTADSPPADAP